MVTGYVGVDPTSSSCHVGNLVPIMGLIHLQRAGHRPVLVMGGATARVGDPSGKNEMRQLLSPEEIDANVSSVREQLSRYLDLAAPGEWEASGNRGLVVNNADWILPLGFIDFLREVGRHFSINRMLAQESVRLRLESASGLSFLEFNYSVLQAYDFLVLHRRIGCTLQLGGSDQWGNICAGVDLIRRVANGAAHGITFPLVTTAGGQKMGKSEKGAVWLDARRTSPYDYYQYWVNTHDADVGRFLRLFTLLDLAEIEALEKLPGAELRKAKQVLAYEATRLTHGDGEAKRAESAARALFLGADAEDSGAIPTYAVARADLEAGIAAPALFAASGLCESRSAARRLARQGGLYVHGDAVTEDRVISLDDLRDGAIVLRAGKKSYLKVVAE
jgi:tyrosyl-tRNA synthetase